MTGWDAAAAAAVAVMLLIVASSADVMIVAAVDAFGQRRDDNSTADSASDVVVVVCCSAAVVVVVVPVLITVVEVACSPRAVRTSVVVSGMLALVSSAADVVSDHLHQHNGHVGSYGEHNTSDKTKYKYKTKITKTGRKLRIIQSQYIKFTATHFTICSNNLVVN